MDVVTNGELTNEWINWADLLHADANSEKLKITLIIFGWGCGQKWAWDSNFWMNEWNLADFLKANIYIFRKVKSYFNSHWVGMIKYGCSPISLWDSIICYISRMNGWIERVFCMFIHSVRKAKSYFGYAHGQIWMWRFRSWVSKICSVSRTTQWIELIFACWKWCNNFLLDANHALYLWLLNTEALHCSYICHLLLRWRQLNFLL